MTNHVETHLIAVFLERSRQEELKRAGKFSWTCSDPTIRNDARLVVLAEEFGEVAREVCEGLIDPSKLKPEKLYEELIQVAAVAVAWAEGLMLAGPVLQQSGRLGDAITRNLTAIRILTEGLQYAEFDGHNMPKRVARNALVALGISENEQP